jgi:hypothetical protein
LERHRLEHLVVLSADELAICRRCYEAAAHFGRLSGGHPMLVDLKELPWPPSGIRRNGLELHDVVDRDWLLILGGLLVMLLVVVFVAVCSTRVVTAPDNPPEPEIEEVMGKAWERRRTPRATFGNREIARDVQPLPVAC